MNPTLTMDAQSERPTVSVIVPVYNAERWLGELIASLRAQSFADWECVLVDDGSTDGSPAILAAASREDARFRVVTKKNGGLSDARNFGLGHVRGEWIFFVDADDALMPDCLERLLDAAARTGAAEVMCDYHRGERMPAGAPRRTRPRVLSAARATSLMLYQRRHISHVWGTLFRRETFLPDGPRFYRGWYEDVEIHPRLFAAAGRVAYLPEKLYFYRQNPESFVNRYTPARLDILRVTEAHLKTYRDTPLESAARSRRYSAVWHVLRLLLRHGGDAAFIAALVRELRRDSWFTLLDPRVRLRNKAGAVAAWLPLRLLRRL